MLPARAQLLVLSILLQGLTLCPPFNNQNEKCINIPMMFLLISFNRTLYKVDSKVILVVSQFIAPVGKGFRYNVRVKKW